MSDGDLTGRQVVLYAVWGTWIFLVALWLTVSTVVYVAQSDAGSFIGGGMVLAFWTVIAAGITYFVRKADWRW